MWYFLIKMLKGTAWIKQDRMAGLMQPRGCQFATSEI